MNKRLNYLQRAKSKMVGVGGGVGEVKSNHLADQNLQMAQELTVLGPL